MCFLHVYFKEKSFAENLDLQKKCNSLLSVCKDVINTDAVGAFAPTVFEKSHNNT